MRVDSREAIAHGEARILGFRALVTAPRSLLSDLFALLPVTPPWATTSASTEATFEVRVESTSPRSYQISRNRTPIWTGDQRTDAVAHLEWAINATAVEHLSPFYLIHGGAVSCAEHGLVLPGRSGSGKTTLVAALLGRGLQYLSDEVVVVDPATHCLFPFAKSLYVRPGSRALLAATFPQLEVPSPYCQRDLTPVWYLPPRPEWLPAAPVPVRFVVMPSYTPGAPTSLVKITRSMALQCFLEQSFTLRDHDVLAVRGLVHLLERAECFRLAFGDVHDAVEKVVALLQSGPVPGVA